MFQLTEDESRNLKSQFATSSWGGRRTMPFAFTEHGVLMLSSVLTSERAIQVNIRIMRIYVKIRHLLFSQKDIMLKVERIEHALIRHDDQILTIFTFLEKLDRAKNRDDDQKQRKKIGFKRDE